MRFFLILCTLFMTFTHAALLSAEKKSICLNMIVKDEAEVIEKCLSSVKPIIDYWVIVDTGSSDGTQKVIKKIMKGIPGELHERPWKNFAYNRNEALSLAKNKGDYVLLIDADEVLEYSKNFSLPSLEKDLYFIPLRQLKAADVKRNGLIKNSLNWKWEGVLHEVVSSNEAKTSDVLPGVVNICNTHGENSSGRAKSKGSQIAKYAADAKILEQGLIDEPNNSRYAYYLGVSYSAAEQYELAKKSFQKRLAMQSSDVQETFLALYNLGLIQAKLNEKDEAIQTFLNAHAFRPIRAETLFQAAKLYREKGNVLVGFLLAKHALSHPVPHEENCIPYPIYEHDMLIEYANCALLMGNYQEGYAACAKLLANPNLPSEYKSQVESNYELARRNIAIAQNEVPFGQMAPKY